MVVVRFGPSLRRWLAVGAACAVTVGVLRWGLGAPPAAAPAAAGDAVATGAITSDVVALTVDAGSGALIAPLARALAAAHLPATIFVDAAYAAAHPGPLRALAQAGDEVEVLAGSGKALAGEAKAVAAASDQVPLFAEPAGGAAAKPALLRAAGDAGLAVVDTAVAPPSVPALLAHLSPGEIARLSVGEAQAIPALAQGLTAGGYEAVTLEALTAIAAGAAATSLPSLS